MKTSYVSSAKRRHSHFHTVILCAVVGCGTIPGSWAEDDPEPSSELWVGDIDHAAFRLIERRQNHQLRTLLREGLPPNLRAADGTSLLMYAALHGDAEGVGVLLKTGADPNAKNRDGTTALIWGAGDLEKVRLLVGSGAEVNAKSKLGTTPLMAAAAHSEGAESIAVLLKAGADLSARSQAFLGLGALEIAAYTGNIKSVRPLVDHSAKANGSLPDLTFALHASVDQAHPEITQYLLERADAANVSPKRLNDRVGDALGHSDLTIARQLLDHGARASATQVAFSDVEMDAVFPELIEQSVDLNKPAWRNYTALDLAKLRGHTKMERLLREAGGKSGRAPKEKPVPNRGIRLNEVDGTAVISSAVDRSVSLLLRSSDVFMKNRESCNSCHHQDLPAVAASIARSRGLQVAEDSLIRISRRQIKRWSPHLQAIYEGNPANPDPSKTRGYLLWGRSAQGLPPDAITKATVWQFAAKQLPDGSWHGHAPRMPMQDGPHMGTALGLRALKMYPLPGREAEFAERIQRARRWLETTPARLHTHEAFRLLGLAWGDADSAVLRNGIEGLVAGQKRDGGWSQLPILESDAWATGLALLALHAAGMEPTHQSYRRGMEFLLNTQFDDGSWFVRSRSRPSQPHFDSHFPFGWDQWISAAGTALASASLALSLEPVETQAIQFTRPVSDDGSPENSSGDRRTKSEKSLVFEGTRTIDFKRDVRPILEASCLDCHSGTKPKGRYKVTDRASLLAGGESGVPTFRAGHGAGSQLIRHVTNQVEDMEMPPLGKRKSYPALTQKEVNTLKTWINEGAPWPREIVLEP